MTESRLPDYLDHIRQAATHACSFVEGQRKQDFLACSIRKRVLVTGMKDDFAHLIENTRSENAFWFK